MSTVNPKTRPQATLITDPDGFKVADVHNNSLDVNLVISGATSGAPVSPSNPLPVSVTGGISGTFTVASEGPTGAPVPPDAMFVGFENNSGNLTGVSLTNPLPTTTVAQGNIIDPNNSTTTPLGAGATFTGTPTDVKNYATMLVSIFSDQDSATNGLRLEFSPDGVNWDFISQSTYIGGTGVTIPSGARAQWFRIIYVNGATPQGVFRLENELLPVSVILPNVPLSATPSSASLAIVTESILVGIDSNGVFHQVGTDTSGNLNTVNSDTFAAGDITNTQSVQIGTQGRSSCAVLVTGTWGGNLDFEVSIDGLTWITPDLIQPSVTLIAGTTVNGTFIVNVAGFQFFRVIGNTVTSGTAHIVLQASIGYAGQVIIAGQEANLGTNDLADGVVGNLPSTGYAMLGGMIRADGKVGYMASDNNDNLKVVGISGFTGPVGITQTTSPWIVAGGGTAGSPGNAVLTVQGITGGTQLPVKQGTSPWVVGQSTAANLNATVIGTLTNNNAAPAGTNVGALTALANAAAPTWTEGDQVLQSIDLAGNQRVIVATGSNTIGKVDILGNAGATLDAAPGATAPTNAVQVAGVDYAGKTRVVETDPLGNVGVLGHTQIPVIIQKANGVNASSTTLAVAFGANVKAGNTIVVSIGVGSSSALAATITDSLNNVYQTVNVSSIVSTNIQVLAFFAPIAVGGADTVTLTINSAKAVAMQIYEVQGLGMLDTSTSASATASSASVAVTASQENDLAFFAIGAGAATISATSPASPANISSDSGNLATGGANLVNFAAFSSVLGAPIASNTAFSGNVTNSFNVTLSGSVAYDSVAFCFRPAALQVTGVVFPTSTTTTPVDGTTNAGVSVPSAVNTNGTIGNYIVQTWPYLFNGTTWDRQRSAAGAQGTAAVGAGSSFPKIVQKVNAKTTNTAATLTVAITPQAAGNLLIVSCAAGGSGTPVITDNGGNFYQAAGTWTLNSTTFGVGIFYAVALTGGASVTVTMTPSGGNASMAMEVYEVAGLEIGGFDAFSSATNAGSTTPSSGAVTPSLYPEYAFGAVAIGTAAQNLTVTAGTQGFVNDANIAPTTPTGLFGLDVGSALCQNTLAATFAGTITSEPWAACIATFRPTAIQILGTVIGSSAVGSTTTTNPVLVGGLDFNSKVRTARVDYNGNFAITAADEVSDAFGRLRVSTPITLFDAQFQYDTQPLLFNTSLVGSGAVTKTTNESSLTLSTGGTTNTWGAINQTKSYFRYEPGKSEYVIMTGLLGAKTSNVRSRIGYFDTNDGVYFEMDGTAGASVNIRSSTSGSPVNTSIAQASWNQDKMDGTGTSGITIDFTKTQIFVMDLQWLGVGRCRFGFFVQGSLVYCHEVFNANSITSPYMNTASLPARAEIFNTGTAGGTTTMKQICVSVMSEGGIENPASYQFAVGNGATQVTAASGTRTSIMSIQPKTTFNSIVNRTRISINSVEFFVTGSNPVYWELVYNGTLGGAPSFNSVNANSGMNFDVAGTTCTGGTVVASGYAGGGAGSAKSGIDSKVSVNFPLTLNFAGNAAEDTYTLAATGIGGTAPTTASALWTEIR